MPRRAKNLLLDEKVADQAEELCLELGTSMSRLIEDFLGSLPQYYKGDLTSPIVRRLYGAANFAPLKSDDYRDALYGRGPRKRAGLDD